MVRRKSHISDYCPSARSLDVIGDWWSLLIVRDAFDGVTRFGEFQKSLGIARNILTARLRTLVDRGILEAVPISEGGARQEYRLTQMGRDLFPVMVRCDSSASAIFSRLTRSARSSSNDRPDDPYASMC